jgi:hypothetical protein
MAAPAVYRIGVPALLLASLVAVCPATAAERQSAATFYVAQLSGESGWEDVLVNPFLSEYVDAYLVAATLSRRYRSYRKGALQLEAEGQVVYNFGAQRHWELNAVPVVARWNSLPWWRSRVSSSLAFGLGLSYATRLPPIEVDLEGESSQLLIYWLAELTAGPLDRPWAVSLRLHHRSVGYGLMGDEGGMNAMGIGVRYSF